MAQYYRPIAQSDTARPIRALPLAGGWCWFTHVEVLSRQAPPSIIDAHEIPAEVLLNLTKCRPAIAGMDFSHPLIMGILNITPDSFSDGGVHNSVDQAVAGALSMHQADILDIGGESTRPGSKTVAEDEEINRTEPVIAALRDAGVDVPLSIDTRKAGVARAALAAGATLVNDVAGFTFDQELAPLCVAKGAPVCVMHAQGDPATMQDEPQYDHVLLDVYDFLARQIDHLVSLGMPRTQIIADPGIGFGKTLEHNLALLSRMSVFHGLGVPVLLGASRKRLIGQIADTPDASQRLPGSIALALAALKHGTQIVRVHDVPETAQAIALWRAAMAGQDYG